MFKAQAQTNTTDTTATTTDITTDSTTNGNALEPLAVLLKAYPTNYQALARFIGLSRKAGSLPVSRSCVHFICINLRVICVHIKIICMCVLFIQYIKYYFIVYYLSYIYAALLQDVTKFLPSPSPSDLTSTSAMSSAERSKPGYLYCQGLYARYTNDVSGAILYFNKVCVY